MRIRYKITNHKQQLKYLQKICDVSFDDFSWDHIKTIFIENNKYCGCCIESCEECIFSDCHLRINNYTSVKHVIRQEKLERICRIN